MKKKLKPPRLCKEIYYNDNHLELWCGREKGHGGRHTEGDRLIMDANIEDIEMKRLKSVLKKVKEPKEPRKVKDKKPRKIKELIEPVEPQDFNDQPIQPVDIKIDVSQLNDEEKERRIQEYSDLVNKRNTN